MKKNTLTTAVVAGIAGAAGLAGVANAVNVNPDGLGQVLLFPYYTVNGGNQTLLSVVNTTNQAKAVKVRFLESLNSAEVLDFNLYLSQFDVWTAAVVDLGAGPALITNDRSCTVPNVFALQPVPFREFEFTDNNPDIIGLIGAIRIGGALVPITDRERMSQGHVEMIEMGVLFNEGANLFNPATAATHGANGIPANCAILENAWTPNTGIWSVNNGRAVNAPNGGLFGTGSIVDVAQGRALTYNADAIDGFYRSLGQVDVGGSEADLHFRPGSVFPNLGQARNVLVGGIPVAQTNTFANGNLVRALFADGLDAVSASLMAQSIFNEYNLETGLGAASEWVITFPTKRLHVYANLLGDVRPFTDNTEAGEPAATRDNFDPFDTFGSCETVSFTHWNREERTIQAQLEFSPPSPQAPGLNLCWEANVLAFNQTVTATSSSAVLGASAKQGARGTNLSFDSGWARMTFNNTEGAPFRNYLDSDDVEPRVFIGLPVIGFWAADYRNANAAPGVRANYSAIHAHRSARNGFFLPAGSVVPGVPANGTITPFNPASFPGAINFATSG